MFVQNLSTKRARGVESVAGIGILPCHAQVGVQGERIRQLLIHAQVHCVVTLFRSQAIALLGLAAPVLLAE